MTARANAYVDGELGLWSAMQVRIHMLVCKHCRDFVDQMRTVAMLMQGSRGARPAEEPKQELLDAFRKRTGGSET